MIHQTHLDEYSRRFEPFARFERRGGVLLFQMQTEGGPMKWTPEAIWAFPEIWRAIDQDEENEAVIWTGTGDAWIVRDPDAYARHGFGATDAPSEARIYDLMYRSVNRIVKAVAELNVPIVAAFNGPCEVHPEALMSDLVIAAHTCTFHDLHYARLGLPPGDGVQFIYRELMGTNRAQHFLLLGQTLSAQEALALGMVGEVLPSSRLLDRAWQLADEVFMSKTRMQRRLTRALLAQRWREMITREIAFGMAHETLASAVNGLNRLANAKPQEQQSP